MGVGAFREAVDMILRTNLHAFVLSDKYGKMEMILWVYSILILSRPWSQPRWSKYCDN